MSPPNTGPPPQQVNLTVMAERNKVLVTPKNEGESHKPSSNSHLEEEDEENTVSSDEPELVVPPDGGWGWMVVAASFLCNVVVDGTIYSFGMFLDSVGTSFNMQPAQVSLVGALTSGFYLIAGPFASALANRYGFRLVVIIGSLLAAAAFILSYFATSFEFLCLSYGIIGGIALGFIYVPSVIIVGYYFERWRALATGIAVCGSGIGTFILAPITTIFINSLGWRNAILCQGAIVFSCIIFAFVFRPVQPRKLKDVQDIDKGKDELQMDITKLPKKTLLKMEEALSMMRANSLGSVHPSQSTIPRTLGVNNNADYPTLSEVYNTISLPQPRVLQIFNDERRFSDTSLNKGAKETSGGSEVETKEPLLPESPRTPPVMVRSPRNRTYSESASQKSQINRPLYRDDIFFGASLSRLSQYASGTSLTYNLSVTRLPTKNDIEEEKKNKCKLCPEAVRRVLATMLDVSLLKSPTFLILAFGGFLTMMGFYIPFMYITNRAVISGMPADTALWLLSVIGISNTVGRVLCGVLSSFPGVNALIVTNVALTVGGAVTLASGISFSPEYQFVYAAVFGLAISCFASLRSVIVVDLLGLEKLTNAFGLLLLFQGIAAIIGTPVAGSFQTATGSYDASFYLSGSLLIASAIMCYPLNWINKWEKCKTSQLSLSKKSAPV